MAEDISKHTNSEIPLLTNENIDSLLIERCVTLQGIELCRYLVECFKTNQDFQRNNPELQSLYEHCTRSIISQALLAIQDEPLQMVDLLEGTVEIPSEFIQLLFQEFDTDLSKVQHFMLGRVTKQKGGSSDSRNIAFAAF